MFLCGKGLNRNIIRYLVELLFFGKEEGTLMLLKVLRPGFSRVDSSGWGGD